MRSASVGLTASPTGGTRSIPTDARPSDSIHRVPRPAGQSRPAGRRDSCTSLSPSIVCSDVGRRRKTKIQLTRIIDQLEGRSHRGDLSTPKSHRGDLCSLCNLERFESKTDQVPPGGLMDLQVPPAGLGRFVTEKNRGVCERERDGVPLAGGGNGTGGGGRGEMRRQPCGIDDSSTRQRNHRRPVSSFNQTTSAASTTRQRRVNFQKYSNVPIINFRREMALVTSPSSGIRSFFFPPKKTGNVSFH
jgi:hypothetical protein